MTEDRAISLNAVIKAVDKHTNDDGTLDDDISCILEDLPPITPQPENEIDHEYCENCLHVEMCKWYGYTGCEFKDTYEDIAKEYVRPNGHWIIHKDTITLLTGNSATGGVICSECGYKTYNKAHVIFGCPYKFCPSCGSYNGGDDNVR